jgi:hypothetical protein
MSLSSKMKTLKSVSASVAGATVLEGVATR